MENIHIGFDGVIQVDRDGFTYTFDQRKDQRLIKALIIEHVNESENRKAENLFTLSSIKPGLYQVDVEVEIVEVCRIEIDKGFHSVARIKSPQPEKIVFEEIKEPLDS